MIFKMAANLLGGLHVKKNHISYGEAMISTIAFSTLPTSN